MDIQPLEGFQPDLPLLSLLARVDEFKGRWSAGLELPKEGLAGLRRVATIESVGSSTRIEGVRLTDAQVEELLAGLQVTSFASRDEEEVAGYAAVIELVLDGWPEMALTESHILGLHSQLMKFSGKDQRHRGHYKRLANHVEAFDASGNSLGVIFETATPFETPHKMEALLAWTAGALEDDRLHDLLVIAIFVVRFLAIHPFQDGNGRLSRCLTTLLLLRSGYGYVAYSSFEAVIESRKDEYYLMLRRAQATLDRGEAQLNSWIEFFLACMVQQAEVLERRVAIERRVLRLPALSASILEFLRRSDEASIQDLVAYTNANRNTVRRHASELVRSGRLELIGKGRGAKYRLIPEG